MENRAVTDRIVCSGALLFSQQTSRVLLLQKLNGKHASTWGLVGGTNIKGENPWQGLQREITEEIGFLPTMEKVIPLERFVSNDAVFNFYTYFCVVEKEFIPTLSNEHSAWGWFDIQRMPKPLHSGLSLSLRNKAIQNKIQTIIEIIDVI